MYEWEVVCAICLALVLAATLINVYGNKFGFRSTKEVSDSLDVWVVAASFVFTIWMVIYGFQISMIVLSFVFKDNWITYIGPAYICLSAANIAWLLFFSFELIHLSYLAVVAMWIPLAIIYYQLQIYYFTAPVIKMWAYNVPFSLYFGWVTCAWFLNYYATKDVPNEMIGRNFLLTLPIILVSTVYLLLMFNDVVFAIAIIWGLSGIFIESLRREKETPIKQQQISLITTGSLIGICIVAVIACIMVLINVFGAA